MILSNVETRLLTLEKARLRLGAANFTAMAVLLASILGVNLQISLVGFKLSNIEHLKEIIIFATTGSTILSMMWEEEIAQLRALRSSIFKKLYGMPALKLLKLSTGPSLTQARFRPRSVSEIFEPTPLLYRMEQFYFLVALGLLLLLVAGILAVYLTIIVNCWTHPTINAHISHAICVVSLFFFFSSIFAAGMRKNYEFLFISKNRLAESGVYNPDSQSLSPESIKYIQDRMKQ